MIIVLLLFFQSICLYCQRLVLLVHDRWINPKNARLLKEADELPTIVRKQQLEAEETDRILEAKRARKRYLTQETYPLTSDNVLAEACRFCANTPQGYCRHHFHLQELNLQQKHLKEQQQRSWNPLVGYNAGGIDRNKEYRQLRKINRELKRNLKNRLNAQQQQQAPIKNCYHFYQPQLQKKQQQPSNLALDNNNTIISSQIYAPCNSSNCDDESNFTLDTQLETTSTMSCAEKLDDLTSSQQTSPTASESSANFSSQSTISISIATSHL